jgi:hypothetical protein
MIKKTVQDALSHPVRGHTCLTLLWDALEEAPPCSDVRRNRGGLGWVAKHIPVRKNKITI